MPVKVKEWLFNLNNIYNNIDNTSVSYRALYEFYDTLGTNLMNDVDAIFMSHILIYTNSFIDEWKLDVGVEVLDARKICAPVFKYINQKWPEIKDLRNNILAHNHRDKNKNSIHFSEKGFNYKVPIDLIEVELLVALLKLIIDVINYINDYNYDELFENIKSQDFTFTAMNVQETNDVYANVRSQISNLLTEYQK